MDTNFSNAQRAEVLTAALPYIKKLTRDGDPEIASTAEDILENSYCSISDFRSWTYTESAARRAVD